MSTLKRYNGTNWETIGGSITGDTLPIGSEIDYTGSSVPAGWEEVADYSTSEVDTGKKWIDGKPIYRKVISGSINSTTGTIQVSDLETLIKYYGNCTIAGSNDKRPFPFYELNSTGHLFDFSMFGNGYINYNSTWNVATYQITIEYTKTTD